MRLSEKLLQKQRKNTSVRFTLYLLDEDQQAGIEAAMAGKEGDEAAEARLGYLHREAKLRFNVTRVSEVELEASRDDAKANLRNRLEAEGRTETYGGDQIKFFSDFSRSLWLKLARHVEQIEERNDEGDWKSLDAKTRQALLDAITKHGVSEQQVLVNEYLAAVAIDEKQAEADPDFLGKDSPKGS